MVLLSLIVLGLATIGGLTASKAHDFTELLYTMWQFRMMLMVMLALLTLLERASQKALIM